MKKVRGSAPQLQGMIPYDPKYMKADVLVSANESPLNLPDEVREAIVGRLRELDFNRYPDPLANRLRKLIAEHWGVKTMNVLCGNGGDELLYDIFVAWGGPGRKLLNFPPTFSVYETNAELTGTEVYNLPRVGDDFHVDVDAAVELLSQGDIDLVVLTSPNNPTGMTTSNADIVRILDASDALVLVDEAYIEFAEGTCQELLADHENLIILHTFSKAYRCAGVRLGYFIANQAVIDEFKKVRQPYSVDAISQIVGEEVMQRSELFEEGIEETKRERAWLLNQLAAIDRVDPHPSESNFILFHVPHATFAWTQMYKEHSVLVRNVSGDPRLAACLRVSVGTHEENERFIAALKAVLAE